MRLPLRGLATLSEHPDASAGEDELIMGKASAMAMLGAERCRLRTSTVEVTRA